MAIKSQQLRQSFLVSGAGIAVLLVLFVAWITSNRVGNVLEQQADVRGRDVATPVAGAGPAYPEERRGGEGRRPRGPRSPTGGPSPTWRARAPAPPSWAAPTRYCATTCAPTRRSRTSRR